MQLLFTAVLLVSVAILLVLSPDGALSAFVTGTGKGLQFCIKMYAVYAVWLSVLSLWEKTGVNAFLSRKSEPLWRRLFPGESSDVYAHLSVNLSANFLGMGSAGTPAGIRASAAFRSPKNRTMLLVVNSSSVQLIPTTVVALRASFGATQDVILPTLLATSVSTFVGILLVKLLVRS